MAKTKMWRRMLGLALSVIMLLGMAVPAFATGADDGAVTLTPVDNSVISAKLGLRRPSSRLEQEEARFGNVRVSIVLEGKSTIEAGYSTQDIADNASAMAYRATLESKQSQMAMAISAQALGGAELDVVWNLTLAANIISANVPYEKIDAIKAVPGVADVVIETRYEPAVVSKGGDDPNMATSPAMIGTSTAYGLEYTGAGSRIAIIDTGTDVEHISFDGKAYEQAIINLANEKGEEAVTTFAAAVEALGLELLTKQEIAGHLGDLHISKDSGMPAGLTADKLYLSSKLPFAFNYIDKDLDVTHDVDRGSEHGSHVAGIATANSLVKKGDKYVSALDEVFVQGVAPEAQLITMKVFGKGGGAYDSDYMVAIEDAIILKCDAINLSLGSSNAGSRMSATYQGILDSLADSDTVVVISAGNAGTWADEILGMGAPYLYSDDVNLDTVGSPGSFANAFTVASVNNTGYTGTYVQVGEDKITYSDTAGSEDSQTHIPYTNLPMTTLDKSGKGTEYEYIFSTGYGSAEEVAAIGKEVINGKIFFCSRGNGINFSDKAKYAVEAGAVATIIYNNAAGTINLAMSGYPYTAPAISITRADGAKIRAQSNAVKDDDGNVLYYTGKITVFSAIGVIEGAAEYPHYTMSDFSSWGVPGDLSLKPEITAPGGSIYSVNGSYGEPNDAYEQMSGTSMAAPQVTGMVALVAQYLRETYQDDELPDGLTPRQLAQSLLMSTAKPMLDSYNYFYPVLQQGAGLADVGAAVTAHSYIKVDGQDDYKVKVELGDDAARTGVYTFSFTLNNLTDAAATYELGANVFTQYLLTYGDLGLLPEDDPAVDYPFMLDTSTDTLPADTTFTVDGEAAESVTVAAGGSAEVAVTIALDSNIKSLYDAYSNFGMTNGAYVEAYVWVEEQPTDEGEEGTCHSIPVLGFYGNWSDASMFDKTSLNEYLYGVWDYPYLPSPSNPKSYNISTNYIIANSKTEGEYIFGGNPMAEELPEAEDPYGYYDDEMAHSAMNNENGDKLSSITFANIRNAGNAVFQVVNAETGEVCYRGNDLGSVNAAYYYANGGAWQSINKTLTMDWAGTMQVESEDEDENGNPIVNEVKLPEGAQVWVQLVLAPELYGTITSKTEDGKTTYSDVYDWDALMDELGAGAFLSFPVTIDNTPPYEVTATRGEDEDANILTVSAKDNGYIAAVAVYNEDGTRCLAMVDPNIDPETGKAVEQAPGQAVTVDIDMDGAYGTNFYVAVYDYALNQATYKLSNESFNQTDYSGTIVFQDDATQWSIYEGETEKNVSPLVQSQVSFTAAAYVDGYIFGTDAEGNLYVAQQDNLDVAKLISNIGVSFEDMTYNAADGMLYGVAYDAEFNNVLCAVDKLTGEIEVVMDLAQAGLYDPTTIACDGEGTFYSIDNGDGHLYSYTLDSKAADLGALDRRFNDAWALEYDKAGEESEGKLYWAHYVDEPPYFDLNGDGRTDAKDAQFILEYAVGNTLTDLQKLYVEIFGDFNGDGAVNTVDAQLLLTYIGEPPVGSLVEIEIAKGGLKTQNVFSLSGPVNALVFPKTQDGEPEWLKEAQYVVAVTLSETELDIIVNETAQLAAYVTPWTLTEENKAVTWASSDETVATVDENGVVTGVGQGTAKITATSVKENAEGEKVECEEACTVTVTAIKYTINGALQDENGNAKFYTFDLENMTQPKYGEATGSARAIASTSLASDGNVYVADDVDGSYAVHKVDPAAGEELVTGAGNLVPLCDFATSTVFMGEGDVDLIHYVYGPYLMPLYPFNAPGTTGFNLANTLGYYTGAGELVAIASGGLDKVTDSSTGETLAAEWLWAVDDAGYVWYLDIGANGRLYLKDFFEIDFHGETPSFQGYQGGANYCSLVESDDGFHLFLTTFNEGYGANGTSEIYMLTLMTNASETELWFDAKRVGSVGDGVWPATLYEVAANGASSAPGTDKTETLCSMISALGHEPLAVMTADMMQEISVMEPQSDKNSSEISVRDDALKFDSELMDTVKNAESKLDNTELPKLEMEEAAPNKGSADPSPVAPTPGTPAPISPAPVAGSLMNVSYAADKSSEGTVGADVTATNSVNGLLEVAYNAKVLTLEGVEASLPEGAIYAVNDGETGNVILAYASPTNLKGKIFHLDFSYSAKTAPNKTVITVKTVEENDKLPDSSQKITVTLKEAVVIPPAPPSKPATKPDPEPTPTPEPEPEPTVTVTENEDGSTTTTVVDNETGTVTETTELPDGTVEVVVTEKDGTVTQTVTDPDGTVVEKVTDPEENVSITVTDPEGEVLVNLELPAVVPESETRFEDVPEGHWADEAIHEMAALGIVNGVGDNLFDMEYPMTRGMLATVLFRMSNGAAGYEMAFDDVNESYSDAVAWAAKVGVVMGVSENSFAPDAAISREQLVTMLYRYAKVLNLDTTVSDDALNAFADADEVSSWAQEAMAWCVENGIIFGVGNDTVDPSGVATRAQVAVIFVRFMALMK